MKRIILIMTFAVIATSFLTAQTLNPESVYSEIPSHPEIYPNIDKASTSGEYLYKMDSTIGYMWSDFFSGLTQYAKEEYTYNYAGEVARRSMFYYHINFDGWKLSDAYDYKYDNENRLIEQITYAWSDIDIELVNSRKLTYEYNDNGLLLSKNN